MQLKSTCYHNSLTSSQRIIAKPWPTLREHFDTTLVDLLSPQFVSSKKNSSFGSGRKEM